MKDFRAVIFDMDGVIVNSEPHHERAFYDVIHELGYDGLGGLKFADYVGRSDFELWVDFIAKNKPAQTLEELLARKRQRVMEVMLSLKGLHRFFSVVVSASDVKHGKPAPDIFLRAAELLKVKPKDCVVIEDSKPGVAAGLAAGMKVIAITNTYPATEICQATHVARTYEEIGQVLLGSR